MSNEKNDSYYRARDNNREKRQFMQMAACAMLMGGQVGTRNVRECINKIHEIWDEIVNQTPEPRDE